MKEEEVIAWKSSYKRIRCNGHIINLAVQAFLFKVEVEQINSYEAEDEDENFQDMGALGKLHNIIVHT